MNKSVIAWLEAELSASEERATCLVAHSRRDHYRLRTAHSYAMVDEIIPGAYVRPSYWSDLDFRDRELHKLRAFQAQHPTWVFAGPSAAFIRNLSVSRIHLSRICVATSRSTHHRDTEICHCMVVSDDKVEEVGGLRVTSLPRTVGDCLCMMDFASALAVADSALHETEWTPQSLAETMSDSCKRKPNMKKARAVLSLADGRAESGGESIARAMMLELGMVLPDLQRKYDDPLEPGKSYRADFAWDVAGGTVLGELDGNEKYTNVDMTGGKTVQQLIEEEHRRQSHIETRPEVLRIMRFGFADVRKEASFLQLLYAAGVPRMFAYDERVVAAGGVLRCR